MFLEALGQVYAKEHGIEVLAVRLGWCPRDAGQVAEIRASELVQDVYLSPGDAGRFFAAAVEAERRCRRSRWCTRRAGARHHDMRYDLTATRQLGEPLGLGSRDGRRWPDGDGGRVSFGARRADVLALGDASWHSGLVMHIFDRFARAISTAFVVM